eukprot:g454.t1
MSRVSFSPMTEVVQEKPMSLPSTAQSSNLLQLSRNGREMFHQEEYRSALNKHYGNLLKLTRDTIGRPTERELIMLGKIRSLEDDLEKERALQSEEWDPVRARMEAVSNGAQRDRDLQVNIYGLETAMQSVATMDAAFSSMMESAAREVEDVEESFKRKVSIGAPNFNLSRQRARKDAERRRKLKINFPGSVKQKREDQAKRLTGGSQVGHPHVAQNAATEMWGFPVYFGPGDFGPAAKKKRERARRAEELRVKSENLRMKEEEEEQRSIARLIEAEERERDYEKFVILADRFGALDGELFCSTTRPGRLYEHLAYASGTLLQIWWKIMWPHRKKVKVEAALFLQRLYRGRLGRRRYKIQRRYEDNVKMCLKRMANRALHATWDSWRHFTNRAVGVRRLMRKVVHGNMLHTFEMWADGAAEQREEREEKLRIAARRLVHRQLVSCLAKWVEEVQKILSVKRFMKRMIMGFEARIFLDWSEHVREQVRMRKEIAAASLIQRCYRGSMGRKRYRIIFLRKDGATREIQRIVRGHLGRRKFDIARMEAQRRIRKEIRAAKRASRRAVLEKNQEEELERLQREEQELAKVAEIATLDFAKSVKKRTPLKKRLKARTKELQREHRAEKQGKLKSKDARKKAMDELRNEVIGASVESARAAFREQHPVISPQRGMEI